VFVDDSRGTLLQNTIKANSAGWGAGVYCGYGADPTAAGNVIAANAASYGGGGILCEWASPSVSNNTFIENSAPAFGGAASFFGSASSAANNLIAFNTSGVYRDPSAAAAPTLTHNCVYGNTIYDYMGISPGEGDISVNPMIADRAVGDYHITAESPCINAGSGAAIATSTDMDGEARIWAGVVDIGADEFHPDSTSPERAKSHPDGAWVGLERVSVSAVFDDSFYVQALDRHQGVRVTFAAHQVSEGQIVSVAGVMRTAAGERFIEAVEVTAE